jgi:hypothetical protein
LTPHIHCPAEALPLINISSKGKEIVTDTDPILLAEQLHKFTGSDLTFALSRIESSVRGVTDTDCPQFLSQAGVGKEALRAAAELKRLAGQINVIVHALGILLCLPHILESGERVENVSLGAGNTGREFDLETSYRIAEFKFIHWRGGPESIRQNVLFKDFFALADNATAKRKYLYVLGTVYPLKFLNGGRALSSVLSRNNSLRELFYQRNGENFARVKDYYRCHRDKVIIQDVSPWLPELLTNVITQSADDEEEF